MPKKNTDKGSGKKQTTQKPQAKPAASKKPRATAANNAANAEKRAAQASKAAATPPKKKSGLKKGAALRTRDEFLENGVPKTEYKDKPEQYYRIVYTVEVNALNEAAVVKRTTKKGRHLKSRPTEKFREEIIVKDNSGDGIKIGKKFIRSQIDDITNEDVEYIKKRISHYPDTQEKMREFKSRTKKNPPK